MRIGRFLAFLLLLLAVLSKVHAAGVDSLRRTNYHPTITPLIDTSNGILNDWLMPLSAFEDSINRSNYSGVYYDSLRLKRYDLRNSTFVVPYESKVELLMKRPIPVVNWLFYLLIALIVLVVLVKTFFTKFMNDIFRSFLNLQNALQTLRQQDVQFSLPAILLMANFYVAAGLFGLMYFKQGSPAFSHKDIWFLPLITLGIGAFFTCKVMLYRLSIMLFAPKGEVKTIVLMDFMIAQVVGVLLLPALLIIAYSLEPMRHLAWYTLIGLLGFMILYRYVLSWRIVGSYLFSNVLHFIIYICSVEIAPVLITIKVIDLFLNR